MALIVLEAKAGVFVKGLEEMALLLALHTQAGKLVTI
jgi:hypothetical protein